MAPQTETNYLRPQDQRSLGRLIQSSITCMPLCLVVLDLSFFRSDGCQWSTFSPLPSLWPCVSTGAGLPDIHWLSPLCPLEVLPHPSVKQTKVGLIRVREHNPIE